MTKDSAFYDPKQTVYCQGKKILDIVSMGTGENGKTFLLSPSNDYVIIRGNDCYILAEDKYCELRNRKRSFLEILKELIRTLWKTRPRK